uniref:Uncharacterized protein n=1 Tax=viral metagenome TaxID=1070528 RepID=A0A6C0DVA7_9ZZZZ
MGLIQSLIAATKTSNVAPTPVADTSSNTVESQSSTEPVKAVELVKEQTTESTIVKETVEEVKPVEVKPVEVKPEEVKPVEVKPVEVKPVEVKPEEVKPEEVKPEEVKPVENVPKTPNLSPTVTVADNISANERYVTPVGTKVEVAPVNVTPNADVVKKNKKHKKNKN